MREASVISVAMLEILDLGRRGVSGYMATLYMLKWLVLVTFAAVIVLLLEIPIASTTAFFK